MKYLIFASLLFITPPSIACKCFYEEGYRGFEQMVSEANSIFIGEVIKVVPEGEIVELGERQTYQVTVETKHIFKGRPKRKYKLYGSQAYRGTDTMVVGGCNIHFQIGDKYLVYYEKGRKIWLDTCSENVAQEGSIKYKNFMEKYREP